GATVGKVKRSNESIVTSGIYERYLEVDGERYHHLLDPDTGYPFENDLAAFPSFQILLQMLMHYQPLSFQKEWKTVDSLFKNLPMLKLFSLHMTIKYMSRKV